MRRFRLHAFGVIMYLVLALLKVASVNFTLNEYMMMMMMMMSNDQLTLAYWTAALLLTSQCRV